MGRIAQSAADVPVAVESRQLASGRSAASFRALPSICFVSPKGYSALSTREDVAHVGGAERQQVLLARELARRGHAVSFVVHDHGQPDGECVDQIRVFTCYQPDAGWRGVRFFYPRLSGLWSAMRRANADLYYQRGAESETGFVGNWCRRHGRGFVFAVAHDTNCLPVSPLMPRRSERWMFRHGLARADVVIAQTRTQQRLLRQNFAVESRLVGSCCELEADNVTKDRGGDDRILWIGRISEEKRPEWLIHLARELPQVSFDVVGQCNVKSQYGASLMKQIRELPNVIFHGFLPHAQMKKLYQSARLLLCTSESEGFPNVFLEAWSLRCPVVSTVDPDGVIAHNGLGRVATELETLKVMIDEMVQDPAICEDIARRTREYVVERHSIAAAGDAMQSILQQVCDGRGAVQ